MSNIKPKYTTVIRTSKGTRNGKPFDQITDIKHRKYRFNQMHGDDPNSSLNIYELIDGHYHLMGVHKKDNTFEIFIPELGVVV